MQGNNSVGSLLLGLLLCVGLLGLGYQLSASAIQFKEYERTVVVKGLSEQEHQADIVIWPIQFSEANNDLEELYYSIEDTTKRITDFLIEKGIAEKDITYSVPAITDKQAQQWGDNSSVPYRYTSVQTVTVYSNDIEAVRKVMSELSELGKGGIVFTAQDYASQTEYLFSSLNGIKPQMVEEATRNAREVAQKFAADSQSSLGKIKRASQGQFSISERDKNNPHIKKVRVVSTIEYYLSD